MLDKQAAARMSALIMARRREKDIGLREAAVESGISASTLSRLERGALENIPDSETLLKLADWLGVALSELLEGKRAMSKKKAQLKSSVAEPSTPEVIAAHLRADKNLSNETARALADMFKALYAQCRGESDKGAR